jgi:hypothetical protein
MRASKSIAAAVAAAAILIITPPRVSMAQVNSSAGATAPATSSTTAHPKHHKKKQSFMKRMKGKFEKTIQKAEAKKLSRPKRNGPAKAAGPSPGQIE